MTFIKEWLSSQDPSQQSPIRSLHLYLCLYHNLSLTNTYPLIYLYLKIPLYISIFHTLLLYLYLSFIVTICSYSPLSISLCVSLSLYASLCLSPCVSLSYLFQEQLVLQVISVRSVLILNLEGYDSSSITVLKHKESYVKIIYPSHLSL